MNTHYFSMFITCGHAINKWICNEYNHDQHGLTKMLWDEVVIVLFANFLFFFLQQYAPALVILWVGPVQYLVGVTATQDGKGPTVTSVYHQKDAVRSCISVEA